MKEVIRVGMVIKIKPEYTGDDFEADMAKLDKHPRNIEWLKVCDPIQIPLEGYDGWGEMEQVYFNE